MKKMLFIAAAAGMMFTSCKKDENKGASGGGTNTFKIGSVSYNADYVMSIASQLTGSSTPTADMSNGGVSIGFPGMTLPTTSGTYKIVAIAEKADEVAVTFTQNKSGTSTAYAASGSDNKTAVVTVSGGKVKVEIPEIWVVNLFTGTDSLKASANITQK